MPYDLTREQLDAERGMRLGAHGSDFYTLIGYYTHQFCVSELILTRLLAYVLDMEDEEKFDLLVRGMDARVKCDRLRKAAASYSPMESKLADRIKHFESAIVPLRNKLMHSWPQLEDSFIYFTNVAQRTPFHDSLEEKSPRKHAPKIEVHEFFRQAVWLGRFADDLLRATENLLLHGHLGIIAPHSTLPGKR